MYWGSVPKGEMVDDERIAGIVRRLIHEMGLRTQECMDGCVFPAGLDPVYISPAFRERLFEELRRMGIEPGTLHLIVPEEPIPVDADKPASEAVFVVQDKRAGVYRRYRVPFRIDVLVAPASGGDHADAWAEKLGLEYGENIYGPEDGEGGLGYWLGRLGEDGYRAVGAWLVLDSVWMNVAAYPEVIAGFEDDAGARRALVLSPARLTLFP